MSVEARIQTLTFSMWGKHSTEPLQQHQCLYITSLVSWQLRPMLYGHMDASWPTDIKLFTYMYDLWPKIKILKVSLATIQVLQKNKNLFFRSRLGWRWKWGFHYIRCNKDLEIPHIRCKSEWNIPPSIRALNFMFHHCQNFLYSFGCNN